MLRRLAVQIVATAGVGRNLVVGHAAEISVQGKLCAARVEVPERGIENAERAHDAASAALQQRFRIHFLPQAFHTKGVLPDELRRENFLDGDLRDASTGAADIEESDGLQTLCRSDMDHALST